MKTQNTIKPIKKMCSVEGCKNEVAEGNRFLCRLHYHTSEENDVSNMSYAYNKQSRPMHL